MAVTRTLLKNLAQSGLGPAQVLQRANALLVQDNDESMFVTLFVGLYDTKTGRLQYANGGHNPPYLLDAQGNVLSVCKATGPIVGVIEGQDFAQGEIKIEVGNELVLYTDGVTEAHAEGGELFGEKRFEKLLSQHAGEKVERLCDVIVKTVNEYQKGNQYDDITLLVLRRNE